MIRAAFPSGLPESLLATLEARVIEKARSVMTARRFLDFEGPLGGGIESLQVGPVHDALLDEEGAMISARRAIPVPTLYSTFEVPLRELEGSISPGVPLDTTTGEDAAERVALAEERILYRGAPDLHIEGMLTHPGAQRVTLSEWSKAGGAIGDVIEAADRLDAAHVHGPFALVLAPALYNQLFRKYEGSDVLALDHIRRLADGGIYKSSVLESAGVLVSPEIGPIVCAQDLEVRFTQVLPSTLSFVISSALVLRIDDPKAACVLARDD
jgi:uncharacterized linocin/CFP29 family protein